MKILLADTEGDDLFPDVETIWTIQIAEPTGPVEVYADQKGYKPIKEGLKRLSEADKVAFHNAFGYDFLAIEKLYPGTLRRGQIIDTLVMSRLMNSTAKRHSLKDLGEFLGFPKGDHEDFSQFSEEMVKYGIRDVEVMQRMWSGDQKRKAPSFGKFYEKYREACELEFEFAWLMAIQEVHGVKFDMEAAIELEGELRQEQIVIERELQEIFPPIVTERWSEKTGKRLKDHVEVFNPGSRDQIAKRLKDRYDWKPIDKTPTGKPKVDEDILEKLDYPEAKKIARFMRLGKMLGQLSSGDNSHMKHAVEYEDGTYYIHHRVNTLGTRTHRCSHSSPNLGQVDADPRMRSNFGPNEGQVMVGVDADGLELRKLAHYLAPYDGGRYAKAVHSGSKEDETDVHNMNKKAVEFYLRDSAKTLIYAHNYGCFDKKLGIIWYDDRKAALKLYEENEEKFRSLGLNPKDIERELKNAKAPSTIGKRIRAKLKDGTPGLEELIAKCCRSHDRKGALPGIDGRWIPSASAHSALNTLLQGNGSIVMKKAEVLLNREIEKDKMVDHVEYLLNVHDEFQLSVDPDYAERVAELGRESIRQAGEYFELRCPLVGDSKIGKNWSETH